MKRALLDAAAELFAARGVAAVSVRDIAARAGVNHGLVHRHFGSKTALRRAVMDDLAEQIAQTTTAAPLPTSGEPPVAFIATAERGAYWRMLARALLDGEDPRSIQGGFPVVRQLLSHAKEARRAGLFDKDIDPRLVTAMGVALGLGWLVFEPFLLAATGLGNANKTRLRAQVFEIWMRAGRTP